ncbi:MAG: HD family phosphohydrolase [Bacillota bacterium]
MFKKIRKWWENLFKESKFSDPVVRKILWGTVFFIIIVIILTIDFFPNQLDLSAGEVSNTNIVAEKTTTFTDEEKTNELRDEAAESAPRVYEENQKVSEEVNKKIDDLFATSAKLREQDYSEENRQELTEGNGNSNEENSEKENNKEKLTVEEKIQKLITEIDENYSGKTYNLLITGNEDTIKKAHEKTKEIMNKQLENRILPDDIENVKNEFEEEVEGLDLSDDYQDMILSILNTTVQPNMNFNEEGTQERREEARQNVEPVTRTVRQGEVIIRKGDVVTEEDIQVLEALGLQKPHIDYINIIGVILVILILIISAAYYLWQYKPQIWNDNKKLVLIEALTVFIVLLAKIISIFQINYLLYLVPVAAASILIAVLIDSKTSIVLTLFISMLVALVFGGEFDALIVGFIGGLVGIFSVSKVSQRSDLVRAGFYVSGVLLVLIFALNSIQLTNDWVMMTQAMGMGVLNGILVAVLANGLLPYLENGFGFTSAVKLLELSNPSQPLLKRMLVEAPGTYHHSVIVGNLAEAAADKVDGADSLLARVAAYYHDIGKLRRPYFFIDNQFGGENPHDKISANLSSLIIKSHVKDGVELAKEYKLPDEIIDIIKQHHGTNLISFFYQEAVKNSKHDEIKESDFRYDGPKPQSKEAAIIMLADIVEATVRSKQFNKNNHNRIESFVRSIIREKLTENQLDECDLSLKDLDIIAENFVKVLTGIYHQRVEYPDNLMEEIKEGDKND